MRSTWARVTQIYIILTSLFNYYNQLMGFVGFLSLNSRLARIRDLGAKGAAEAKDCAVCMNECHEGKELACGHAFHLACLTYATLTQPLGGQEREEHLPHLPGRSLRRQGKQRRRP